MKKFLNIIFSAALLLGAISCTELLDPALRNSGQVIPEGATVTLGFAVPDEVTTKGDMADDPLINTIHVLSFDKDGILVQAEKAELKSKVNRNFVEGEQNTETAIYCSMWKVELLATAEERTLHFVANLPEELVPSTGSEKTIFQSLATTGGNASYWQRITLEDGIEPYTYEGGTSFKYMNDNGVLDSKNVPGTVQDGSYKDSNNQEVNTGDYIDRYGNKIVDGTGYYYVPEEGSPLLHPIHLVRNFARIRFTNSWTGFNVTQVYLVNYPKSGFVAPYDNSTHKFVPEYENIRTADLMEEITVTEGGVTTTSYINHVQGYKPTLPETGLETDFTKFTPVPVTGNKVMLYMYERGIPSSLTGPATALLIGGTSGNSTTMKWYKIELAKEDGSYFEIYRDMTYDLNLKSIDASAISYGEAEQAYNNAPVGDISGSNETATLTQITDGKGLVLWVHEIDHPELNGGNSVPLLYCFVFENQTTHAVLKDFHGKVTFKPTAIEGSNNPWATPETLPEDFTATAQAAAGSAYANLIPTTYYPGCWYYVMVPLESYTDKVRQSLLHVTGAVDIVDFEGASYAEKRSLSRDVTYTVMNASNLKLETSQLQADAASNPVTLTIELPTTLARGVFPLTFKIEAQDNNLTPVYTTDPNLKMPAETGTSSFAGGKSTYYFLRTVSYDEYKASDDKKFACNFVTTKSTGKETATTPVTKILVSQKVEEGGKQWFVTDPAAIVDLKTTGTSVYPSTGN